MRRRNPLSRNGRRTGGPPAWPADDVVAFWREALVMRRGLLPGAPTAAVMDLVRAGAWAGGIDMTTAPDEVVMGRVWTGLGRVGVGTLSR